MIRSTVYAIRNVHSFEGIRGIDVDSKTLADIAGDKGMTIADVAFLAGIEESTVSRLWVQPGWLDKVKGRTLQAIISVVPGVAESLADYALFRRRRELIGQLADTGILVREDAFRRLVTKESIPEQWISSALQGALYVMQSNDRAAAACLTRFWGHDQDRALSFIWTADRTLGLFTDTRPLLARSSAMSARLADQGNSFHAMVAYATFAHHIAKATGYSVDSITPTTLDRRTVMAYRSGVIGRIIQTGDVYETQIYTRHVQQNTLLSMLEGWAFPTFTRDAVVTTDFSVPRSLLLRNFARYVLREMEVCNDAYLQYLITVAIPIMLQRDSTLGLRSAEIQEKLQDRIDACTLKETRVTGSELLDKMSTIPISIGARKN